MNDLRAECDMKIRSIEKGLEQRLRELHLIWTRVLHDIIIDIAHETGIPVGPHALRTADELAKVS